MEGKGYFFPAFNNDAFSSLRASQSALASAFNNDAFSSLRASQSALASAFNNDAFSSLRASQSALASAFNNDAFSSLRASQSALASAFNNDAFSSLRASQSALASAFNNDAFRSLRTSQSALAGFIGSATIASIDLGQKINALVDAGAITRLQDSLQNSANLGVSLAGFQSKLAQTVHLGIPKEFLENLNRISSFEVADYSELLEDKVALLERQIEQDFTELEEELNKNPAGIWNKLNAWATDILEVATTFREKQPFVFLVLQIMLLIATFVVTPAVQDIIKEKVLHEINLTKEDPAKNAKEIKGSLSKELDGSASLINEIRVTNRKTPVFRSNKRKSGQIDSIQVNRPVIILNKKRNWCFIIYVNQHQEEVTGWVFTGNLVK